MRSARCLRLLPVMTVVGLVVLSLLLIPGRKDVEAGDQSRNSPPKSSSPLSVPIIRVSEIRPGMKGYGLTTFRGTKPEKFELEVIDVLRKALPKHDLILVRCSHPIIDKAHIIAGMSGSPIYIEGKLAGALAYGWIFTKEPIAGVTPIEWMLKELPEPRGKNNSKPRLYSRPPCLRTLPKKDNSSPHLPSPRANGHCPIQQLKLPVYVSGVTPQLMKLLAPELARLGFLPLQGASGSATSENITSESMVPGAPLGVELMRGDIRLVGIGTLTYRDGERVLAFGHPMLLSGYEVSMPITTAYVHGVMPGMYFSFKFASPSRAVGTLTQDRMACVAGTLGRECPMIPVSLSISSVITGGKETVKVEVIDNRELTPLLVRIATLYLIFLEGASWTDFAVDYVLEAEFEKYGKLRLTGVDKTWFGLFFSEPASLIAQVLSNPFEKVKLKKLTVKMKAIHKRIDATIESAWLEQLEVVPGKEVNLRLLVRPFGEKPQEVVIPIHVPPHLDEGKYDIIVGGGGNYRLARPVPPAESVRDIFTALSSRFPANMAVAVLKLPSVGVAFKGRMFPQLPNSVFGTLLSSSSAGAQTFQDGIWFTRKTPWLLSGETKRVTLVVKR